MNRTLAGIPLSALANKPTTEELGHAVAQLSAADFADFLGYWEWELYRRHGEGMGRERHDAFMAETAEVLVKRGGIADELEGALGAVRLLAANLPQEA